MSMLSGQGLGPTSDGPRKRHPVTTAIVVLLMCAVLFGATYGAVRLLRGPSTDGASSPSGSPSPCVTTTVVPGVVLPKPGQVTSNVFNATTRAGLAKRTSAELQSRGFVIGRVANDPLSKKVTGVAEIRYGASGLANAQLMRYYVIGAVLVKDGRKDASIDVVLGDKFKVVTPQKAVDAALKKPTPVATGANCTPVAKPSTKPSTAHPSPSPSA
jgi:hypothetical protein